MRLRGWSNGSPKQFQDGGVTKSRNRKLIRGRHLEFRKNVNTFGLDKDILHQIIWEDAPRRRRDDHVTKSRNRRVGSVVFVFCTKFGSNICYSH